MSRMEETNNTPNTVEGEPIVVDASMVEPIGDASQYVEVEKAFERLEDEDPHYPLELSDGCSTTRDWDDARYFLDFLQKSYAAIVRFSGSLYVTSNLYFTEACAIESFLLGFKLRYLKFCYAELYEFAMVEVFTAKVNSSKYKVLSEVAQDVLAILVYIVSSEAAFSMGDRVIDQFRSSLTFKAYGVFDLSVVKTFDLLGRIFDDDAGVAELQKEDRLMACSLMVIQNVQELQRSMMNFQHEKKHSDELKKAQKQAATLEDKVERKERGASYPTYDLPGPMLYSLVLLPSFDEEEYFSLPAEREKNISKGTAEAEVEREKEAKE
ncbi:hypothetical protein Acr_14g0004620 [Actinidia rufa]|uniref:HAT C-terminal dimerisation domain-containing protein n=1 Tax=Actinidia rufa TaxID=165716 RepID=A0A7J0FR14_9ERIC|nr:hypothetical protein Acr_14g0004620 [Actinidia rufa]